MHSARGAVALLLVGAGCAQPEATPSKLEAIETGALESKSSALVIAGSYKSVVEADAPIGYWRLGERSGSVAQDSRPAQNHGAYTATYSDSPLASLDAPGALVAERDGAPAFYPSNNPAHTPQIQYNWVEVPHHSNQAPAKLSLELWLTIPGSSQSPGTFSSPAIKTTADGSDGYGFYWYGNNLSFYVNNYRYASVSVPIPSGGSSKTTETTQSRFHHLVGTYDPSADGGQGVMAIYFDGRLVATRATTSVPTLNAGVAPLRIAKGWLAGWFGKVDEVALYDKALSLAQIQTHYQTGLAANPSSVENAVDGDALYGRTIVTPPQMSTAATPTFPVPLANTVADLRQALSDISGTTFNVVAPGSAGIDPHAIRLIRWCPTCTPAMPYSAANAAEQRLLNDLAARDLLAFAVISDPSESGSGLKIISRSEAGLTAGIYSYLRVLGARYLLPSDRWKFLPSRSSVRWNSARVESSDFAWGTGYFAGGGFAWNLNKDKGNYLPDTLPYVASRWDTWQARNLLVTGVSLGGQIGTNFNVAHKTVFQDPPSGQVETCNSTSPQYCKSWRARTGNATDDPYPYTDAGNYSWHVSNVDDRGFQGWFANTRLAELGCKAAGDPFAASNQCSSTEAADGASEDASPKAVGAASGNPADNAATLANATAKVIGAANNCPGRYASYMAYGTHVRLPDVALEPNVAVTLVPYNYNYSSYWGDALVTQWAQSNKARNLSVQDFWGFIAYPDGHNTPRLDMVSTIPNKIRFWKGSGMKSIWHESTSSGGASALPWYVAGQLAWNTKSLDDKLRDSLFESAFGAAGTDTVNARMRALFEGWRTGYTTTPNQVALDIDMVLKAYDAATDPKVKARVADFAGYVRYLQLYYEWTSSRSDASGEALLKFMWEIHDRAMVQTAAMMLYVVLPTLSATAKARWGAGGAAWATLPAFNAPTPWVADSAIVSALRTAQSRFPIQYQPVVYTGPLAPVPGAPLGAGSWVVTQRMTGNGRLVAFYAKPSTASITFQVRVSGAPVTVRITSPAGGTLSTQMLTQAGWNSVQFNTQDAGGNTVAGVYSVTLDLSDKSKSFQVAALDTQPFAVAGGYQSVDVALENYPSGSVQSQTWFYAPPNVTFAILCQSCSVRPNVTAPGAAPRLMGSDYEVFNSGAGGFWQLSAFKTDFGIVLLNIPSYFSPRPSQALTQSR
jgi:hypothetical protein